MDLGSDSTSKLEPFLLMSKAAKGAAAAKLIQDATSAPGVYVFGELLELPHIQELASSEQHAPYYSLLQLFSYKSFPDYIRHKDELPPLNDAQLTKLKHLTLVTLAMEKRILPYQQLLETLQISSIRELEDLIIDAIYGEVIRGRLNQKEQRFEVEYTMGRDVEPGKVEGLLVALQHWASTTSAVLETLDDKLAKLSAQATQDKAAKEEYDKLYAQTLHEIQEKSKEIKIIPRPANAPKSGMTEKGREYLAARQREAREKEAKEKETKEQENNENSMDVDDEEKGGARGGAPRRRGRP